MRAVFIISAVLLLAAGAAFAQTDLQKQPEEKEVRKSYLYQWVDEKGVIHVTDNFSEIPKKYRNKVLTVEQSTSQEGPTPEGEKTTGSSDMSNNDEAGKNLKAAWQQRMKLARQRLVDAQQRYQELEQKRNEEVAKSGASPIGQLEGRIKAQQMEADMQHAQKNIDDAQNEVENVIPEEARRAGVPPGWLRE